MRQLELIEEAAKKYANNWTVEPLEYNSVRKHFTAGAKWASIETAAAPELLEALQDAVFTLQGYIVQYGHSPSMDKKMKAFKAVIAKATDIIKVQNQINP